MDRLVAQLSKLPGVGEKTARRFAFHILNAPEAYAEELAGAIIDIRRRTRLCSLCCNVTEEDPCDICRSSHRDGQVVCVVERPTDVLAIDKTGEYRGLYHVLHGVISPLDGIGPDDIKLAPLLARLRDSSIREVIVATNPSVNGEATATYIHRLVAPLGIQVTRIALGIPVGADIEFADKVTLGRALAQRRPI
ncbi:MAG: recombination protein RecR [Bradymonadales bacterium]|nr:recombination protein RecR [Bradymonadales bacterium]